MKIVIKKGYSHIYDENVYRVYLNDFCTRTTKTYDEAMEYCNFVEKNIENINNNKTLYEKEINDKIELVEEKA